MIVDGGLKELKALRGMDVDLEQSIDEGILDAALNVEVIVAPVADESLWEEASRYSSSSVPCSLLSCGVRILLLLLFSLGRDKAMVVVGLGFRALDGLADEDEEADIDPLRVIWVDGRERGGMPE